MKRHNRTIHRIATATAAIATTCALTFSLVGCGTAASNLTPSPFTTDAATTSPLPNTGPRKARDASQDKSATILVYMNGSDLESYAGEASSDISEMLASGVGNNVNVVIQTLGTSAWQDHGIASDHTQRYRLNNGKLELVDDSLGQLDTTAASTLSDFIRWGVETYPADRYMLLMWDHGAGPVYGFGYDEFQGDYAALTLDEMQSALNDNANVHFDLIGMDCCLMSSIETCQVLAPYCDYTILSEDFEPGVGWSYEKWLRKLEENPGIQTSELGTSIVVEMISAVQADPENGEATLALIDESAVPGLFNTWLDFAYANKDALLSTNYSQQTAVRGRPGWPLGPGTGHGGGSQYGDGGNNSGYGQQMNTGDPSGSMDNTGFGPMGGMGPGSMGGMTDWGGPAEWSDWDYDTSYVTMSDYYVTDIRDVASAVGSDQTTALEEAAKNAIVHYGKNSGEEGMTGIGVTLPYGDSEFYDELVKVFTACGIDKNYVDWLGEFVNSDASFGESGNAIPVDSGGGQDAWGGQSNWGDQPTGGQPTSTAQPNWDDQEQTPYSTHSTESPWGYYDDAQPMEDPTMDGLSNTQRLVA